MEEKVDYKKIILMTIAAAGILSMAVVAPNAVQILGLLKKRNEKYKIEYYLNKKTKKLIRDGLIKISRNKDDQYLTLSKEGEKQLTYYRIKDKKKPKAWDGKWRVVIFDVWENSRNKRNLLRYEIKNFGFIRLQGSVWIYPYPCADFIELLKADLSFGKNIRYMVVEKLDHDEKLRKLFGL